MRWSLSVIQDGVEYPLSDGEDYLLLGLDGIGPGVVERLTQRGPLQHGQTDVGFRLQPRTISIALMVRGGSDDEAWMTSRNRLARIFAPSKPITLRLSYGIAQPPPSPDHPAQAGGYVDAGPFPSYTPSDEPPIFPPPAQPPTPWSKGGLYIRQIDCYLNGMMEMAPEAGINPRWQRVGIELIAPDPTWYDPRNRMISFTLAASSQYMEFPLVVPIKVGAGSVNYAIPVAYDGSWDAFPIIKFYGPMTSPRLTNETLGVKLDFTGITIASGDSYVVDTRYGFKSVTRTSDGANRISDLTLDSNLSTFRIAAHPLAPLGVNTLRLLALNLGPSSQVSISYNTRYLGV